MTTDPAACRAPRSTRWSPPPAKATGRAFDELVRRTYVDTYTLAMRLTANEEDARDVVQETYLRAWRGIHALPRRRPVLHVDVPDHGQHRLHPRRSGAAATGPSRSPEDAHGSATTSRPQPEAAAETAGLGERLAARGGRAAAQAAGRRGAQATSTACRTRRSPSELGISVAAAKVRLHRGRKRLRDVLFDEERGGPPMRW